MFWADTIWAWRGRIHHNTGGAHCSLVTCPARGIVQVWELCWIVFAVQDLPKNMDIIN